MINHRVHIYGFDTNQQNERNILIDSSDEDVLYDDRLDYQVSNFCSPHVYIVVPTKVSHNIFIYLINLFVLNKFIFI